MRTDGDLRNSTASLSFNSCYGAATLTEGAATARSWVRSYTDGRRMVGE